jgi:hypothetical protein
LPELPAPKSYFVTNTTYSVTNPAAIIALLHTNWAPDAAFYTLSNSYTGEFSNYFAPAPASDDTNSSAAASQAKTNDLAQSGTNAPAWTNQVINITIHKSVPQDPTLEESASIMRDYISLLTKSGMLTVSH